MIDTLNIESSPAFWLDEDPVTTEELMGQLMKNRKLEELVKDLILSRAITRIELEPGKEKELLCNFRKKQNLENEEIFENYLQQNHITKTLLIESLSQPHKVVKYREERWGPRANSLYLKYKDLYDKITYKRLQCENFSIMQEVYFRLKDKEETWESMSRQFAVSDKNPGARITSTKISQIEPPLLRELRNAGPGVVIKPLQLSNNIVIVAELELIEASSFNDEIRADILRRELQNWIEVESTDMMRKLRISK